MHIRDRIKELRRVPAKDLRPNPRNWRVHPPEQQDALRAILAEVGYAGALLARECDDGALELIDGHLRAETTPDVLVPVLVLDVTEAEAAKILATHDPLAAMAEADAGKINELLQHFTTDSPALCEMLAKLTQPPCEPITNGGEPEESADPPMLSASFQLLVTCVDEESQRKLFEQLKEEGYECRVLTM